MIKIDVFCKRNFLVLCVSMCINLFVVVVAEQEDFFKQNAKHKNTKKASSSKRNIHGPEILNVEG